MNAVHFIDTLSLLLARLYVSSQSSVIRFDKSFLDIDRDNVAMMKKNDLLFPEAMNSFD